MGIFTSTTQQARISHKLQGPKRLPSENFKEYQKRRKFENSLIKRYMKGEQVWYPGGKRSLMMLASLANDPKSPMDWATARQIVQSGKGTLKGNPTGKLQPNGLPERHKPVIKADREK